MLIAYSLLNPGECAGDCRSISEPTKGCDLFGARHVETCTWGFECWFFLRDLNPGSLILML